jgi:hypothetical protein
VSNEDTLDRNFVDGRAWEVRNLPKGTVSNPGIHLGIELEGRVRHYKLSYHDAEQLREALSVILDKKTNFEKFMEWGNRYGWLFAAISLFILLMHAHGFLWQR